MFFSYVFVTIKVLWENNIHTFKNELSPCREKHICFKQAHFVNRFYEIGKKRFKKTRKFKHLIFIFVRANNIFSYIFQSLSVEIRNLRSYLLFNYISNNFLNTCFKIKGKCKNTFAIFVILCSRTRKHGFWCMINCSFLLISSNNQKIRNLIFRSIKTYFGLSSSKISDIYASWIYLLLNTHG